jgi:hypothetical protein
MNKTLVVATAAITIAGSWALAAPAVANLVTNGGFEADDTSGGPVTPPAGWTLGTSPATEDAGVDNTYPHSDNNAAFLGDGTLYQELATQVGTVYSISFWVGVQDPTTQNDSGATFNASFGGTDLLSGGITTAAYTSIPQYIQYTDSVTATSTTTTLSFTGITTGDTGDWYLDDVDVEATSSAMPEPSVLLVLASALGFLTLMRVRRA